MRKVLRLNVLLVVWLFAALYAVIGLYAASKSAILQQDSVVAPLGFEYPLAHFSITITFKLPQPASWLTPVIVLIMGMFYALTGAISGTAFAYFYNLTSKFWPGVLAQTEADKLQPEPKPDVALT
jgi:hypothetical protein